MQSLLLLLLLLLLFIVGLSVCLYGWLRMNFHEIAGTKIIDEILDFTFSTIANVPLWKIPLLSVMYWGKGKATTRNPNMG